MAKKQEKSKESKKEKQKYSIGTKINHFFKDKKKKVKERINNAKKNMFRPDIDVKGKKVAKSYSFEKKFYGLYGLFVFYSLILILAIWDPNFFLVSIATFGNPFAFAMAIIAFMLTLSIFLSNDKVRLLIFEKKTAIKQLVIFGGMIIGYYFLYLYLAGTLNFITLLLLMSLAWLILLSSRFYTYSRKFSTKVEAGFIRKYSRIRYSFAYILPFIIIGILFIIVLFYRTFLVFIALDFFAPNNPKQAMEVYKIEMTLVMPLIYVSLILVLVFMIIELVATRRKAETKRAGVFDNFTFALIIFFLFGFQLFQITIFLILRPETVDALRSTVSGEPSETITIFFFAEFILSMYFLYRVLSKLGGSFGWRFLFFKQDGLILFFLSCVFAQTLTRFALSQQVQNQELTIWGEVLMADKFLISIFMIILLGLTLLIYYLKPQETSMFMRLQKETVKEEDKSMETIYKLIKSEYIRRGESFPLDALERELIKSTLLSKAVVYSLVRRLVDKDMNIQIINKRDKDGKVHKYIDFLSVTERFEKKGVATQKAKEFMTRRLAETVGTTKASKSRIETKYLKKEKASDQFVASLASGYTKKQQEEKKIVEKQKPKEIFRKEIPRNIKNQLIELLKKEYIYRIQDEDKYPDFNYSITEIANQVETKLKINPGELFQFLDTLNKQDIEFRLMSNPKDPKDKRVKFIPIADDDMCYTLSNFRPEVYKTIKVDIIKRNNNFMKNKNSLTILSNLRRKIPKLKETDLAWIDILTIFNEKYPAVEKQLKYVPNRMKLIKLLEEYAKALDKSTPKEPAGKAKKDKQKPQKSKKESKKEEAKKAAKAPAKNPVKKK